MTKIVPMATVIGLLACGSTDNSNLDGGLSGPPCTFTLSGGTTGSYGCTSRRAYWSGNDDTGTVTLGYGVTGVTTPAISASFTFPGAPGTGTLTDTSPDGGVTTRITVNSGSASWAATESASGATVGTYTMTVTNASITAVGDVDVYAVSGTLDATLPPVAQTSATGDVTLHASF